VGSDVRDDAQHNERVAAMRWCRRPSRC
jgi:hypothetical protein